MKKLIVLTLLISTFTVAGFWASKKVCMMCMWPGSVNPNQKWYSDAGLGPEQTKSLRQLDSTFRKDADKLCMQICRERLNLLNLMNDKRADHAVIFKKIEEIGSLQTQLEKDIAAHILKAKEVLTPEQSEIYLNHIRQQLAQSINENAASRS